MQLSLTFDVPAPGIQHSTPRTQHAAPRTQHAAPRTQPPAPRTQHAAPSTHPLVFVRHPRARRYVIRVRDDGSVRVTVPRWGSKREAQAFAQRERAWIDKQRRQVHEERLRLGVSPAPPISDADDRLRDRATRELPARLLELAARYGLAVSRVSVRNQKSRWGSCSRAAHICLNWRLIRMPDFVRDYVMIHELMHLKRMDHSPRFWKLVAAACPEYQIARRWLRVHARP
jgi:predicted metal-dependent hydrolase